MKTQKFWITVIALPILLLMLGIGSAFSLVASSDRTALAASNLQTTSAPAASTDSLATLQSAYEQVYTKVNPSVVNIQVLENQVASNSNTPQNPHGFGNFGNNQGPQGALGSGFVWDTQGHIITNNHVINGASRITVTFSDGTTVDAKLVGADPNSDLAVIQVDVPANLLVPVEVTDSAQVKVGEIAIAIGNPFGLQGTMTQGIISGLERTLATNLDNTSSTTQSTPQYTIPDIIQTDASINPGNSGGVLVNTDGQLIGVTSAIESASNSNSGIGFVIPSAIVQKVVPVLIKSGSYKYSWLGISGTSLTPDLAKAMGLNTNQEGALVVTVTTGGPAETAGLHASDQQTTIDGQQVPMGGDVITAINGQTIKNFDEVISYLFNNTAPGQTINLTILRQGKEQSLKLTLGERPTQ